MLGFNFRLLITKTLCTACIIFLACTASYAENKIVSGDGEQVANFRTYTVHEIPREYLDKPLHVSMPEYWDQDMTGVRVKAIYKNPESPTGTSALYLSPSAAPREVMGMDINEPTMRVEFKENRDDILLLHFVFRQKKGTVCTSPD